MRVINHIPGDAIKLNAGLGDIGSLYVGYYAILCFTRWFWGNEMMVFEEERSSWFSIEW